MYSNRDRCEQSGLGSDCSGRSVTFTGTRVLGQFDVSKTFKCQRTDSSGIGNAVPCGNVTTQKSANSFRQHFHCSLHQYARGTKWGIDRVGKENLDISNLKRYQHSGSLYCRKVQCSGRLFESTEQQIRMGNTPSFVQLPGQNLGPSYIRQVRVSEHSKMQKIQQPVSGPGLLRGRCIESIRLENRKQLCQRPTSAPQQGHTGHLSARGYYHSNRSSVEGKNMVSKIKHSLDISSDTPPSSEAVLQTKGSAGPRTMEKSEMAVVRLEDLWSKKLLLEYWPKTCVARFPSFLAHSTLQQYNNMIHLFQMFCCVNGYDFPPQRPVYSSHG